jgi:DNA-binding XRE family transcriptional regulator
MNFGRHLRSLREDAGPSRAELARRVGVPVSTMRNWEGDWGMPGIPTALRRAEELGVLVEQFAERGGGPCRGGTGPTAGKSHRPQSRNTP